MPPKHDEEQDERPLLGRFKNTLKIGIVGMPNVGKSSFFNYLCKQQADASNFPFCTIDPNESQCVVPDKRFTYLCEKYTPKSEVPAVLKVWDIAGLVKGASEGAGLGNAFLSHIAAVDGIFHMLRAFDDDDISHVENTVDPVRDLDIISSELRAKDIQTLEKRVASVSVAKRNQDKDLNARCLMEEKFLSVLRDGKDIRNADWTGKEIEYLNEIALLTSKPVVYLINLSAKDYQRKANKWLAKIKAWVDAHGADPLIPFSVTLEQELAELPDDAARAAKCDELKVQSALPKIVTTGYHRLNLVHFFTAGEDEVRCWTVRKGTKAPQAAGAIHTDFERGFICANVIGYEDFFACGSEVECRNKGKLRVEGKNYVVQDGDIIEFKFNAGAGLKGGKK